MESRLMPQAGLLIYVSPCVTLTFGLLYPSCCETMGIYHKCLPDVIKSHQKSCQKRFCDLLRPHVTWNFDLLSPQRQMFHAQCTICANWHQKWFIRFQNIVFTSLGTCVHEFGNSCSQVWELVFTRLGTYVHKFGNLSSQVWELVFTSLGTCQWTEGCTDERTTWVHDASAGHSVLVEA